MANIQDWSGFVVGKHFYMVATASGDAWEAKYPIHDAIVRDKQSAADLAKSDWEANQIMAMDDTVWVDWLAVFVPCGMHDEKVAHYDLRKQVWVND